MFRFVVLLALVVLVAAAVGAAVALGSSHADSLVGGLFPIGGRG